MKWSWRIARIAGIGVHLHVTLVILLAWIAHRYYVWRHQPSDVLDALLFVTALFGVVLLHELGHAFAARRFGINTSDITLMPIGGLARLNRLPDEPRHELLIALAGPAVNVLLIILIVGTIGPAAATVFPKEIRPASGHFLSGLLWANIAMAAFNLVPAFPMDGGRVLRSLLALRLGPRRATNIAVEIGQAFAFVIGAIGLYRMNPILVFIALFVYLGAEDEAELVRARSALEGIPLRRVMASNFRTLSPSDPLQQAVEHTLAGFHLDFPVVEGDRLVGMLNRRDLLRELAKRGPSTKVEEIMQREFATATPDEEAQRAYMRLETADATSLPVVENGRVVGILTSEHIREFLRIQSVLTPESCKPSPA
jgi:Zn-dependent protease/CBS domain-containing protein